MSGPGRREDGIERSILPDHWSVLGPMIDEVLDTPPDARPVLVARLCAGDATRRGVLERLVAECEREMPMIEGQAIERFAQLAAEEESPPMPDVLGGHYRLERELGRGGMARVYLAEDLRHARLVAVKVVRRELALSLGRDRFLREIAIAARLRHPNIMPLYDSGDADGMLYFVMPFESGQSLRDRLSGGDTWTVTAAVSVLRDVARALVYAHEQGVVHRDIKPDNVMLSGGAAVVTDFGIAKAFTAAQDVPARNAITQTGVVIGTPAYMSPEQAMGDPATDHRADIYAFGCVAFELLTGTQPFDGLASWELVKAKNSSRAPLVSASRPDVPETVVGLIARCLERNPEDRPQHAAELLDALEATPTHDADPASPRGDRRRVRGAGIAAVVALLVVIALFTRSRWHAAADSLHRILVVLPMQNAAGDSLDYIASGLADDIARRLEGVGGFSVRSGAHSDWPATTRRDYQAVGRQFGATVILKTELKQIGDSLEVRATVANRMTLSEREIAPRRFVMPELSSVAGQLAAAIAGATFRAPNPSAPHDAAHQVDAESYRLTLEGWHELLSRSNALAARALFLRATERDRLNSRAWAGLSSTWGTQAVTDQVPFDEGYLNTVAAATQALQLDSLEGSALANLAIVEAMNDRKASSGLGLLQRAKKVDPSNPEVYLVEQALYLFAWQLDKALADIRIARELDPLTPRYPQREAGVELCANRPAVALQIFEGLLRAAPADTIAQNGKMRSLARLGRYDEALEWWRLILGSAQSPVAQLVREARGADGYWAAKHAEGAARLAGVLDRASRGARVSTSSLAQAKFAAGDFEGGYAALDELLRDQHRAVWRLRCNPAYDEVLTAPRFKQVVVAAGALPLR